MLLSLLEINICWELCDFKKVRSCSDQSFVLRHLCIKVNENMVMVLLAFINLENAYDRQDIDAMWQVLGICGVGEKF